MSADKALNGTQPAVVSGDPSARMDSAGVPSGAERLTAERTERHRQRTAARQAPTAREPRAARRHQVRIESTTAPTPRARLALRDSVSVTPIAVLAAGGVLGAILGALNTAGWVIGVLAAALTVVLSAALRRYSRSA